MLSRFWSALRAVALLAIVGAFGKALTSQALTWNLQLYDTSIHVSGQISHSGVGAATYNGKLYVAYSDHSGDGNLWVTYRIDQFNYSQPIQVPGAVVNNNPTLAVYNGQLFVGWVDPNGYMEIASTTDGINFLSRGPCNTSSDASNPYHSPYDSPSMTVFGSNLVVGFRTAKNWLGFCWILESNSQAYTTSTSYLSNLSLGEAPGLGVFKGKLYVAYIDTTGSRYIYLLVSTDGVNFTTNTGATGNHTTSQPCIAIFNGLMYIGYRQNSSSYRFYYTYSTDGINFASAGVASFSMGGPPALLVGPDGVFYNIFSQNASSHYLATAVAQ